MWFLDPVLAAGAAAVVFFVVLGLMLVLDIDVDAKVAAGTVLLLVGLAILFFLLNGQDVSAILAGLIAALVGKEIVERTGWL